jgi:hypothetical protein
MGETQGLLQIIQVAMANLYDLIVSEEVEKLSFGLDNTEIRVRFLALRGVFLFSIALDCSRELKSSR